MWRRLARARHSCSRRIHADSAPERIPGFGCFMPFHRSFPTFSCPSIGCSFMFSSTTLLPLRLRPQGSLRGVKMDRNYFLFIASDYKPWPGGIAEYIDSLARGLMDLGDTAKVLGVVQPGEKDRIEFLETYEPWVSPFPLTEDRKPVNWLGRKLVS